MSASTFCRRLVLFALALVLLPAVLLEAQPPPGACPTEPNNCDAGSQVQLRCVDVTNCSDDPDAENPPACTPTGCGFVNNCLPPTVNGPRIEVEETASGVFTARLVVDVTARWNDWAGANSPAGATRVHWYARSTVPPQCPNVTPLATCTYAASDRFETFVQQTGLTCAGAPYSFGVYSVQVKVCQQPCLCPSSTLNCICGPASGENATWRDLSGLSFTVTREMLGCDARPPRKTTCGPNRCRGCVGPGVDAAGDGPSFAGGTEGATSTGPGAALSYTARGVGFQGHPTHAQVTQALGRYWLHPYAQAIVQDPDASHVWLLSADATYREFFDANSDGFYELASPSDEYRTLTHSAAGWSLEGLDGSVITFDATGRWLATADKNGNAKVGTYNAIGQLTKVTMPDGREEDFLYELSGKLKALVERGVGITDCTATPAGCRRWEYLWSGPDLAEITRPDGTLLRFFYGDLRYPGYLTRIDHLATTTGTTARPRRVLAAYQYDASGNVSRAWRGDVSFTGSAAVDKWQLSYDDPVLPVVTTVTDPLLKVSTYTFGRDTGSEVPRLEILSGDCPSCGVGPNSQLFYEDLDHPLLPTRELDGNGHETARSYDDFGQVLAQTEAVGTPRERVTLFEHHPNFPAFVTRITRPSVAGAASRESLITHDPGTGDRLQARESGGEATYPGGTFALTTTTTFNPQGQPLAIDPPGYGTGDVTSFTYDAARGNLLPETRTDPLVGTTSFAYEPLNKLRQTIDPNGLKTDREYDSAGRLKRELVRGPDDTVETDDLITEHFYNAFGDLFCTVLPRRNALAYVFDAAGRLLESLQGTAVSSPTLTSCLSNTNSQIRRRYTLNSAGQRTLEKLERYSDGVWILEAETSFTYSSRCHLDKATQAPGRTEEAITEYAYDCDGNLERIWDANHPSANQSVPATTVYTYDELDRLSAVTQPWGGAGGGTVTTSYGYDVQDHLTSVTDGEGNVTSYAYSDRDLMTSEVSPVSGTTTHVYNDHGELTRTTDARGVVVNRTVDALDRVTLMDYPTNTLDVAYTWDDPAVPESKGRLTRISRGSKVVNYAFDPFGRTTQDGELVYSWDVNGNRATITYPGGVTATYTYDFGDRPLTLVVTGPDAGQTQTVVTQGLYKPYGPIRRLDLNTSSRQEVRNSDFRYAPTSIALGSNFTWNFTTDKVGNVTRLQQSGSAQFRSFTYQDFQYYLTQGNGPWGDRAWSYDRIGNRLTETTTAGTDTYAYPLNASSGNTPTLSSIALAGGTGTKSYSFGPAGHLNEVNAASNQIFFDHDNAGQLGSLERPAANARAEMVYDGRGFLASAAVEDPGSGGGPPGSPIFADDFETGDPCLWSVIVGAVPVPNCPPKPAQPMMEAVYSSEGLLYKLERDTAPEEIFYFHFYGRPVAQLEVSDGTSTWRWITVDHLGTPFLLSSSSGTQIWSGGFEPFGRDWREGTTGSALAKNLMLRLPGQWEEGLWTDAVEGAELLYNVHRWYEQGTGRYSRVDPAPIFDEPIPYLYVGSNPLTFTDPLGLFKIDRSCNCTALSLTDIRNAATSSCESVATTITDAKLKKCLDKSCKRGVIRCGEDCSNPERLAYTDIYKRGNRRLVNRTINLCSGNFPAVRRPNCLADVIIHEWAHGCRWQHGDGKGVPGDDGTIRCHGV